jgi:hypothetical protein
VRYAGTGKGLFRHHAFFEKSSKFLVARRQILLTGISWHSKKGKNDIAPERLKTH